MTQLALNIVPRRCPSCDRPRPECEHNIHCRPCQQSLDRFQDGLKLNGLEFDAFQGMKWALARFKHFNNHTPKRGVQ